MQKKVILITGASSGIGKAVASYLSDKNYKVYGTSRNPDAKNKSFKMITLDVKNTSSIKKAIELVVSLEGKIDVLINNAGKGITGAIEETPLEAIKENFETNFFGTIEVIKAVLPQMRIQKSGLIINTTSIAGYMGLPFRGVYSASKGALAIITESVSMEVKQFGINVVNIAPGDFATNIASGRFHTPIYENSAYKKKYSENLDLMNKHVDKGKNPIIMAKAIEKIINKKRPRINYKIGNFTEKLSIVLKRILPSRWYEKLLMNHYKI